ncbi:MAG: hypothetical protein DCC67_06315 [Planctomycetota bacterium]|nr:MAG: hypothetical protein DCC67_06315 [Planctomycetota bacterium]
MQFLALSAHFDGQQIRLDEPIDLPPHTPLIVTVLPPRNGSEDASWALAAATGLARAYGDCEPDYSIADLK